MLGSMEFACKVAGAKIIVVLGHTKCGAIKGACDHVEMGHLTGLLSKIRPVMDRTQQINGTEYAFPNAVAANNVHHVMNEIAVRSLILGKMIESREIAIVGGMYDIDTGVVDFYEHPHLI